MKLLNLLIVLVFVCVTFAQLPTVKLTLNTTQIVN